MTFWKQKGPHRGQKKLVIRFAWLPTRLEKSNKDVIWIWLEQYGAHYVYQKRKVWTKFGYPIMVERWFNDGYTYNWEQYKW